MAGNGLSGPKNGNWKGGRVVDPRGYALVRVGAEHPLADVRGYAYEHRIAGGAEPGQHILRDGTPRPRRSPENPLIECACGCGTKLPQFDRWHRPRRFVSGHNPQTRNPETGTWQTNL